MTGTAAKGGNHKKPQKTTKTTIDRNNQINRQYDPEIIDTCTQRVPVGAFFPDHCRTSDCLHPRKASDGSAFADRESQRLQFLLQQHTFYSSTLPDQNAVVSVEAAGESIEKVLDRLLAGLSVSYEIRDDRQIILTARDEKTSGEENSRNARGGGIFRFQVQ